MTITLKPGYEDPSGKFKQLEGALKSTKKKLTQINKELEERKTIREIKSKFNKATENLRETSYDVLLDTIKRAEGADIKIPIKEEDLKKLHEKIKSAQK